MPTTLELPDDLAADLAAEASRVGMTLADYARTLLAASRRSAAVRSGADLVAFWTAEGVVGGRPDLGDSSAEARDLREQAQRRGG